MSTHTGLNKGTRHEGQLVQYRWPVRLNQKGLTQAENYLYKSLDKAAEASVLTGAVFISRMVN